MPGRIPFPQLKSFSMRIVLPTALAVALFIGSIYFVIVPTLEEDLMERKREMIRELTNSAWSILAEFEQEERNGILSRERAQKEAITRIETMRYGVEGKDYFWITDMHPRMIMHPYRTEMDGQDLLEYKDPTGRRLFVEFVDIVKKDGHGYVQYLWQWKDDPTHIVPKLSYVRGFEPWGWIVGTGIYIQDVNEEIEALARREAHVSLAITVFISLLLVYVIHQSLRIERGRSQAEQALKASREKYRALVEASTEGSLLILDGKYAYTNKTMLDMLGYSAEELRALDVLAVFPGGGAGERHLRNLLAGENVPPQCETQLMRKDGRLVDVLLTTSTMPLAEQTAFIITAKDISLQKQAIDELGESRKQFRSLTDSINLGVFRTGFGRDTVFVEANPAAARILGFQNTQDLFSADFLDLFHGKEERDKCMSALTTLGQVRDMPMHVKRADGAVAVLSVSATVVGGDNGGPRYLDGIVEDVTARKEVEEERESFITQLQTSLLFLNDPVEHSVKQVPICDMHTPVTKAAKRMSRSGQGAILVATAEGDIVGIVTDRDLRERVLASSREPDKPVFEVMSSPLVSISEQALMLEAVLLMQEKGVNHLAVKDQSDRITGIVSDRDLLQLHQYSSPFLVQEIRKAECVEDIITHRKKLPRAVRALVECGAKSRNITRIITSVSDAVVERLVDFAIEELGPPPAPFAFVAMGSEGREEQTLTTDQDNAIIFADVPADEEKDVAEYFHMLAELVCRGLDQAGYAFCKGGAMAMNPKWCCALSKWKAMFASWIAIAEPQNLLEFNKFFDFRRVYGDDSLTLALRAHVNATMNETPPFFLHFAQNTLLYKPPLGLFGKIVVESSGENPETFNIKDALLPVVGFARIYALKHNLAETNTLNRLHKLLEIGAVKKSTCEEVVQAYDFLMQMRFDHQARALSAGVEPDNHVNPNELGSMRQSMLKSTFSRISNFQKRISYDFLGVG